MPSTILSMRRSKSGVLRGLFTGATVRCVDSMRIQEFNLGPHIRDISGGSTWRQHNASVGVSGANACIGDKSYFSVGSGITLYDTSGGSVYIVESDDLCVRSLGDSRGNSTDVAPSVFYASGGLLYVGGAFTSTLAGAPLASAGIWDPATELWTAMDNTFSNTINAFVFVGATLFAGGMMGLTPPFGSDPTDVWYYGSGVWNVLNDKLRYSIFGSIVSQAVSYGGNLVVSGSIAQSDNTGLNCYGLAMYDGTNFVRFGPNPGLQNGASVGTGSSLLVYNGDLVVAGTFDTAGGVACNFVARWDGATFNDMGTGLPSAPTWVNEFVGDLYAGVSNFLYKWNGASWDLVSAPDIPPVLGPFGRLFSYP